MSTVLIVGSEKTATTLTALLVPQHYAQSINAPSGAKARQIIASRTINLVVINSPLPNENTTMLAQDLAEPNECTVILLDNEPSVVSHPTFITLAKPLNKVLLENTLQVVGMMQQKLAIAQEKENKLTLKLEETRLVGRAKCALVTYQQMTEQQAHRYIEKQAMDTRLPKKEIAKEILQMFE